jgi:uncharacterized protein (DUF433 family)
MGTALAYKTDVYPHIVKTPGVRGGKARIDGTRICVKDIVQLHKEGMKPEEMREYYSDRPLTLAEVHTALAYYYDHGDEIEAEFADEDRFFEEADRRWQDLVARNGGQPPENPTPEERAIPRPLYVSRKP